MTVAGRRRPGVAAGGLRGAGAGRRIKAYARGFCVISALDPVRGLLSILNELIAFLREFREMNWSAWLEKDRGRIANGDFQGVEHLLCAFGSMGSINDVALDNAERDARLDALRSALYDCAASLRRARDRM